MRSHGISFPEEDEQLAYTLQRDWESLYLGALYRASTLASTSDRFSDMTQEQINAFVKELEEFAADFEANGPGSVGEDLELGLLKMDVSFIFFLFVLIDIFCFVLIKNRKESKLHSTTKSIRYSNIFLFFTL